MKKTFAVLLLLLATSALAQTTSRREEYPLDYKPVTTCAPSTESVCKSYTQAKLREAAGTYRAFHIDDKWLAAHWDELTAAYMAICARMGSCMTMVDNSWQYCRDIMRDDFVAVCDRYPKGSEDAENCGMVSLTYFIGLPSHQPLQDEIRACTAAQPPGPERTLAAWVDPEKIPLDFNGKIRFYAYDAETHIPIRALLEIDSGKLVSIEGPIPKTGYANKWTARLKRVPRADGHSDIVLPTVTLKATNYKPLTFKMNMDLPQMKVEMSPSTLQVGKNTVTVTARDVATGAPVEARVMAGKMIAGRTNEPFELELTAQDQMPEIWVTSLYDRYSDAVVAKGAK